MSIFVRKIGTKKNTTTAYVRDEISRLPWTESNHFHAPAFSRDFLKYLLKTQIGTEIRIWLLQNLLQGFHFQGHKIYMISIEYVINMQTSIQYFYVIAKIAAFLFKRSSRRLYSEKFIFTARWAFLWLMVVIKQEEICLWYPNENG